MGARLNNVYEENFSEAIGTFPVWNITKKGLHEQVIKEITDNRDTLINNTLRDLYLDNYKKAVVGVLGKPGIDDADFELFQRGYINVQRLANYKAYHVTNAIQRLKADKADFDKRARGIINTFNRHQVTEYNTLTARARTAHQWQGFQQTVELYPNIQWLPSRSAEKRPDHVAFYYRVWAMTDPHWNKHQPGSEYNCKCDWRETDLPITDNTGIGEGEPSPGLEGNPGVTGQLITDNHPYISGTGGRKKDMIEQASRQQIRKQAQTKAYSLKGKKVSVDIDNTPVKVTISRRSIDHIAHDYHEDVNLKNALLPHMDKVLEKATYVKTVSESGGNMGVKAYHYLAFNVGGVKAFLSVRELMDGRFFLFALRNSLK